MYWVRSGEVLAGAGQVKQRIYGERFNEVTAIAGFESLRATSLVLPMSEWVAAS